MSQARNGNGRMNEYIGKKLNTVEICAICRSTLKQNTVFEHECGHKEHLQCTFDYIFLNRAKHFHVCCMCRRKYCMGDIRAACKKNGVNHETKINFICYPWCDNGKTRSSSFLVKCLVCQESHHMHCLFSKQNRLNVGVCVLCVPTVK